jgi:hypothetical protein
MRICTLVALFFQTMMAGAALTTWMSQGTHPSSTRCPVVHRNLMQGGDKIKWRRSRRSRRSRRRRVEKKKKKKKKKKEEDQGLSGEGASG